MNEIKGVDLRQTNIVEYEGHECRVNEIGLADCRVNYKDERGDYYTVVLGYEKIKPIPLTEEWLIKLNVPKCEKQQDYYEPFGGIWWSIKDGKIEFEGESEYPIYPPQYVHEFQNLSFAVNREELVLKEK